MRVLHARIDGPGLAEKKAMSADEVEEDRETLDRALEVRPTLVEVSFEVGRAWRITPNQTWVKQSIPMLGTYSSGSAVMRWSGDEGSLVAFD